MRVDLCGIGTPAETIQITVLKRLPWRKITRILNIEGVVNYCVEGRSVYIRYDNLADPAKVAAQALRVIADYCGVQVEELSISIRDRLHNGPPDEKAIELVNSIWLRALGEPLPEPVPVSDIVARGTAPAYYLV